MTGLFVQNEDGIAEIVANNYYGADLKVDIFNQETNTFISQNLSMTELTEPIINISTTNTNNQIIGDTVITLDSVSGLGVSDRVQIGNYIYKITNIIGSNININKGLIENITGGGTVTNKGNLGIFKITLNIADLGEYTLIGKDPIFGLHVTKIIKVVPKSIETMYKDIKNLEYAILGS